MSLMDNPIIFHLFIMVNAILPLETIRQFFQKLIRDVQKCIKSAKRRQLKKRSSSLPSTSSSVHHAKTSTEKSSFMHVVLISLLILGLLEFIIFGLEIVVIQNAQDNYDLPETEKLRIQNISPINKIKNRYNNLKEKFNLHTFYFQKFNNNENSMVAFIPSLRFQSYQANDQVIDLNEEESLLLAAQEELKEEAHKGNDKREMQLMDHEEEERRNEKKHDEEMNKMKNNGQNHKIDFSTVDLMVTPHLKKTLLAELYTMDIKYPNLYYPPVAKNNNDGNAQIRGCMGPLYGTINWNAVVGWIKYHQKRWGLTHVDIYVQTDSLSIAKQEFDEIDISGILGEDGNSENTIGLNFTSLPSVDPFSGKDIPFGEKKQYMRLFHDWHINQCLWNAKFYKNDYLINFDGDEYLISDSFQTIPDIFEYANNKPSVKDNSKQVSRAGVSFPMFLHNYHRCSSPKPTYGSTTYYAMTPFSADQIIKDGEIHYTDPKLGVLGQRKYIIDPTRFEFLAGVHDPQGDRADTVFDGDLIFYFNGRKEEGQHARLIHYRTDTGIHADLTYQPCDFIFIDCKYLAKVGCTDDVNKALAVYSKTSINDILSTFPLNYMTQEYYADTYDDALCYAKRYQYIFKKFCEFNENQCSFKQIEIHYLHIGVGKEWIWGCHTNENKDVDDIQGKVADAAMCYAERYPQLYKEFCKQRLSQCKIKDLENHYLERGRKEKMIWGCHKHVADED